MKFSNILPPQSSVNQVNNRKNLQKSHDKSDNSKSANKPFPTACTYIQALSTNVWKIFKLKENFSKLSDKKIEEIHKTVNNSNVPKPHINITTKDLSCKQIIISMGSDNLKKFLSSSSKHVVNLNHALKDIKSDVIIDFMRSDYRGLIIVSNKVASSSDIYVINNYVKNINNLDLNNVQDARLPQSKSYLKILGILYLIENTNTPIDLNVLEGIIKATHVFNNIKITSKPCICKVSPKLDMAIVWINILDSQNSLSAKKIIN